MWSVKDDQIETLQYARIHTSMNICFYTFVVKGLDKIADVLQIRTLESEDSQHNDGYMDR